MWKPWTEVPDLRAERPAYLVAFTDGAGRTIACGFTDGTPAGNQAVLDEADYLRAVIHGGATPQGIPPLSPESSGSDADGRSS